VKRLLSKFLRARGYQIVRAHRTVVRQTMEDALLHLAHLGLHPNVVVDVGTAAGTDDLLHVFPRSRFLWIEPLREFERDLQRLAITYRGEYVLAACGSRAGETILHVHPNLTGSSTLHESEGENADGVPRQVTLCRLDDLCQQYHVEGEILLKLDVQGAEFDVLEGAGRLLPSCEVVILEVSLFRFFQMNAELHDVVAYMRQKGFVTYDIVGGTNRLLDAALAQKDFVFVKEGGRFRRSHCWATAEQRRMYIAEYRGRRSPQA
jgi:FkbM family methyltransferase